MLHLKMHPAEPNFDLIHAQLKIKSGFNFQTHTRPKKVALVVLELAQLKFLPQRTSICI